MNPLIIIAGIIIVAYVAYLIWKKNKEKKMGEPPMPPEQDDVAPVDKDNPTEEETKKEEVKARETLHKGE